MEFVKKDFYKDKEKSRIFKWWIILLLTNHICDVHTVPENCTSPPYEPSQRLLLTPFIQSEQLEKAKSLSRVELSKDLNTTSYSGFITVDFELELNLFFWFIPCQTNSSDAPVILWLNDGLEEASSLFGAFGEIGPYQVTPGLQLKPRKFHWGMSYNLLFIDVPTGTGFSFAICRKAFANNSTEVALSVKKALGQFYTLFPEYASNDLYLAGAAYASKHVCSLAYLIHAMSRSMTPPLNLSGVILMSPTIEFTQLIFVQDQLYNLGLISNSQRLYMEGRSKVVNDHLNAGSYDQALKVFDSLFLGIWSSWSTTFQNFTGHSSFKNAMQSSSITPLPEVAWFLNQTQVRNALHLGENSTLSYVPLQSLQEDVMRPYTAWLEFLLNSSYRCLSLNGQFDLLVTPSGHDKFLRNLNWRGARNFEWTPRLVWKIRSEDEENEDIAGYVTRAQNLYSVMISLGGHRIAGDRPKSVLKAVNLFISNETFGNPEC